MDPWNEPSFVRQASRVYSHTGTGANVYVTTGKCHGLATNYHWIKFSVSYKNPGTILLHSALLSFFWRKLATRLVTSNWNGELSWLPSITSTKRHSLWASFTSYKLNGARVLNTNGHVHNAQTAVHELCDEFAASVANQHEVSDAWRDAELRMTN